MVTEYAPYGLKRDTAGTAEFPSIPLTAPTSGMPADSAWVERATWLLAQAAKKEQGQQYSAPPIIPLREHLAKLARWWHKDTDAYSLFAQKQRHEAYQSILAYKDEAVRFMLEDLRDNDGFWYVALHQITDAEPPIPSGFASDFYGEKEAWLRWGRAHGYSV